MRLAAVFDISTFIWDKAHHDANKNDYFTLMELIPNILEKINTERIPVIFRGELLDEIHLYFPYDSIPNGYYDYQRLTLSYLTKLNMVEYLNSGNANISCSPSLLKDYFEDSTNKEIQYLINHLYNETSTLHRLLTFSTFWIDKKNMLLTNGNSKEIEVFICDTPKDHDEIILLLKKVFEHNPKHNKYKSSNYEYYGKAIAPLSCYNERVGDVTLAQTLLDTAVFLRGDFFNFDKAHKTYVIFVNTRENLFHGFEFKPSEEDVKLINNKLNG